MTLGIASGAFVGLEVGKITGEFVVPAYQRGYRWTALEVSRLLQDIRDSEGAPYYLQPIVVRPIAPNRWELIDGQQRLTTLSLIVRHFKRYVPLADTERYSIEYVTRAQSANYLREPTEADAGTNIDFFHLYEAWKAIGDWLDAQDDASTAAFEVYTALQKRVKVIWYEAPESADPTELFTRLNVGRIPLTDAELVKALLLSRSRDAHGTDRARSIAAEWDSIERDLRDPELWAFVTATPHEEATHIRVLLDILADQLSDALRAKAGRTPAEQKHLRGRDRPGFHTFETIRAAIVHPEAVTGLICDHAVVAGEEAAHVWDHVVDLHSLVTGWFEERETFHKIGYLTACRVPFDAILSMSAGATRPEFIARLDSLIATDRRCLRGLTRSGLDQLAYGDDDDLIKSVLLLMNVETIRKLTNSTERYSFQAHAARRDRWSLEHIHAQNSVGLNTVEQWTEWLRQHRDALADLTALAKPLREELTTKIDAILPGVTLEKFQALEAEVRAALSSGSGDGTDEEQGISNLTLLERDDNSALSNAVFAVKRRRVLELDREGSYIPVCTRNVFLKYYTNDHAQQVHFWSPQDKASYLAAIQRELQPYLRAEEVTA
jgi:hypothetical protein